MNYGQRTWKWLADRLDRLAFFCRRRAFPWPRRDDLTQRTRWMATAEDSTLEQYIQECVKYCSGQRANEGFMRVIETTGEHPIPEQGVDDFRRSVLVELTCFRYQPLGGEHAVSRSIPALVNKIDHHLNGDPVWRGSKKPAEAPA